MSGVENSTQYVCVCVCVCVWGGGGGGGGGVMWGDCKLHSVLKSLTVP